MIENGTQSFESTGLHCDLCYACKSRAAPHTIQWNIFYGLSHSMPENRLNERTLWDSMRVLCRCWTMGLVAISWPFCKHALIQHLCCLLSTSNTFYRNRILLIACCSMSTNPPRNANSFDSILFMHRNMIFPSIFWNRYELVCFFLFIVLCAVGVYRSIWILVILHNNRHAN